VFCLFAEPSERFQQQVNDGMEIVSLDCDSVIKRDVFIVFFFVVCRCNDEDDQQAKSHNLTIKTDRNGNDLQLLALTKSFIFIKFLLEFLSLSGNENYRKVCLYTPEVNNSDRTSAQVGYFDDSGSRKLNECYCT
jgi:hypothetical protein